MKFKIVTVTPEIAMEWLKRNTCNRSISQETIIKYANDMRTGVWQPTHEGIAFDDSGCLLDGQHRLMAVVMAKTPVKMVVIRDIPTSFKSGTQNIKTFKLINSGRSRTTGQMLGMAGVQYANNTAAAVRTAIYIASGSADYGRIRPSTPTVHRAIGMFGNEAMDAIKSVLSSKGIVRPPSALLGVALVLFDVYKHEAIRFISEFSDVSGEAKSNSRALATWLTNHRHIHGDTLVKACCSAMQKHFMKVETTRLYVNQDCVEWVRNQNPKLCKKLAALMPSLGDLAAA